MRIPDVLCSGAEQNMGRGYARAEPDIRCCARVSDVRSESAASP